MTSRAEPDDDPNQAPLLDEQRLLDLEPYETFENPVLGHEYRFLERGTDENGEFLRAEALFETGATHFAEHVHERQNETYNVLSGALTITLDDTERTLEAGEQITLPAGVPHYHGNPPDTTTRFLYEVRPPSAIDALLRTFAALARDGRTDAEGLPNLLQTAVILDAYPGTYETGLPIPIQKWLFKLLAPIGRHRGYRTDYAPSQ